MKVSSLVHVLETLVAESGQGAERHLSHAAEELGEVSKAFRNVRESVSVVEREHYESEAQVEAVDLAICALALYVTAGGCPEEFEHVFARKCGKWRTALERSKQDV